MTEERKLNREYFLWKRLREGDTKALFSLYDQFFDTLFNYGLHFSRNKELIKDCIHDLFLDLYKYRKNLSETDNVRYYLLRSLRRLIYKENTRKISVLPDDQILLQNDIPEMAFEDNLIVSEIKDENHRVLAECMKELSDKQREGLALKFEQNLSYKEISGILGISVESARTSVYRALKDLRKALRKKGFPIQLLFFFFRNRQHIF
jgi:RNA polymerase sigma factor (sigma-70 family)